MEGRETGEGERESRTEGKRDREMLETDDNYKYNIIIIMLTIKQLHYQKNQNIHAFTSHNLSSFVSVL